MMKRSFTILCVVLIATATFAAEGDVNPVPLILHAMASPIPALKYPLLPELRDTIPGNAVTHYRQALKNMKQDLPPRRDWEATIDKWLAVPLKEFPHEEVGKFLKQCETAFQEVEAGARSEQCDWGLTDRLRKTGGSTDLPDLQEMRSIGSLLQLRIRYELATGHTDRAVSTLRIGFALARHVADQPSLACAMVGVAISALMENRLEEVIQRPDAPNLYWALTDLPRPFIDMHKPTQGERLMAYGYFPGLAEAAADLDAKPWTTEQVLKGANFRALLENERHSPMSAADTTALAALVVSRHETAKKRLIKQGRPKELVDAMPHLQVAMLDAFLQYDQLFDDSMKCLNLSFGEAMPLMKEINNRRVLAMDQALQHKGGPAIPIAEVLFPPGQKVFAIRIRIDRRIAALCCVEAVRLYAAAHDGKLPPSLEEITDVPMPLDPVTGKVFDYKLVVGSAFLSCTPFPGQTPDNANTPTYELMMRK
jgi:hypothetical protein